jgi:hypothetical protein
MSCPECGGSYQGDCTCGDVSVYREEGEMEMGLAENKLRVREILDQICEVSWAYLEESDLYEPAPDETPVTVIFTAMRCLEETGSDIIFKDFSKAIIAAAKQLNEKNEKSKLVVVKDGHEDET